ncbi:hypothetical protein KIL84_001275 [Mauremys mutica]|uniref:Uncharacterized protein n=1 Tax=Mauremys mutica TaxID=74926 RepID=A0A9D3X087_9SAUR|nr:hypothetical protein KIL84_001275 [Mauremys mutica]
MAKFCPLLGISHLLQRELISVQRVELGSPTCTFLKLPAAATWHVCNCPFPPTPTLSDPSQTPSFAVSCVGFAFSPDLSGPSVCALNSEPHVLHKLYWGAAK